jgi:hypothetical protein
MNTCFLVDLYCIDYLSTFFIQLTGATGFASALSRIGLAAPIQTGQSELALPRN